MNNTAPVAESAMDECHIAYTMMDDQELVVKAQAGDHTIIEIMTLKYGQRIYNVCLKFLHNPDVSVDLTQDIFLKAYRNIDEYVYCTTSFYSWLYRVAVNACIEFNRKNK